MCNYPLHASSTKIKISVSLHPEAFQNGRVVYPPHQGIPQAVEQQGIWKCQAADTPTRVSFVKVKMASPKETEVVTNLIPILPNNEMNNLSL